MRGTVKVCRDSWQQHSQCEEEVRKHTKCGAILKEEERVIGSGSSSMLI